MGKLKIKEPKDKFYNHVEITACMIVKNEEEHIERCLTSVEWCDDVVVVDTGSTDKTRDIISKKFPKVRLFEDTWDNNFSRSRNVSLSKVKTNWTLIIDADEEFVFEPGSTPQSLKENLITLPVNKVGAVKLTLEDWVQGSIAAEFKPTRFFPAKANLKYRATVHNEPIFKGKAAVCGGIKLKHYGYDVYTEKAKMKVERTASLLKARLEKNPDDFEAMFYLTNIYSAYLSYADYGKTMEWAEVYFKNLDRMDPGLVRRNIFYSAAETARRLKDFDASIRWITEGKKRYPDDLDLNYAMLLCGIETQNALYVIEGAQSYINRYRDMEANPLIQSAGFVFTKKPLNLMNALHKLGLMRIQEGIKCLEGMDGILNNAPMNIKLDVLNGVQQELTMLGCESLIDKVIKSNKVVPNF